MAVSCALNAFQKQFLYSLTLIHLHLLSEKPVKLCADSGGD